MKIFCQLLFLYLLGLGSAHAQSNLPACQGRDVSRWTNCFGTQLVKNGVYVGEYQNGYYNGQGVFTFSDGSKYAGEFRNGNLNGLGISTQSDGKVSLSGNWRDGLLIQPFPLDTNFYPFNSQPKTVSSNLSSNAERDRLTTEVDAERKKRQELEQLEKARISSESEAQKTNVVIKNVAPENERLSLEASKKKCTELGFKPATEGYGKCVLQLSK